jgi:methylglyoxal synthase
MEDEMQTMMRVKDKWKIELANNGDRDTAKKIIKSVNMKIK